MGVVPGARLWAIKSMGNDGHGRTSNILCGLDWMIGQQQSASGPKFIAANMSIAGPLEYPNRPCGIGTGDTYHELMCAAMDAGIVIAVAAANDSRVVNQRPAIYDEPITVGAIADFDGKPGGKGKQKSVCPWYSPDTDDTYANFSDWGAAVDILAPGKCILSTFPGGRYAWMSGTSMATPHVAGAIALYRMRYPDAKPQQVKQALVSAGTRNWRTGTSPDGRAYRLLQVKTFTTPPTFSVSAGERPAGWRRHQPGHPHLHHAQERPLPAHQGPRVERPLRASATPRSPSARGSGPARSGCWARTRWRPDPWTSP